MKCSDCKYFKREYPGTGIGHKRGLCTAPREWEGSIGGHNFNFTRLPQDATCKRFEFKDFKESE